VRPWEATEMEPVPVIDAIQCDSMGVRGLSFANRIRDSITMPELRIVSCICDIKCDWGRLRNCKSHLAFVILL